MTSTQNKSVDSLQLRSPWLLRLSSDDIIYIAAFLSILFLVSTYALLPTMEVFGHDEVHYYKDFGFKLAEDGRWLNFMLHGFLRSINLGVWAYVFVFLSWLLFFWISKTVGFKPAYASIIASTVVLAPPLVEQSLWPATTLPAIMVLLFVGWLVKCRVPYYIVYVLCGLLMFGTMQNFYFLVPVFFLACFTDNQPSGSKPCFLLIKHLSWWVFGAIAGVVLMSFILWVKIGHFGVQTAEWRHIKPIHSLNDFFRNVAYVTKAFFSQFKLILSLARIDSIWLLLGLGGVVFLHMRALIASRIALLLLVFLTISFFVFSVPLAPVVQTRSLIALVVGLVFSIAIIFNLSSKNRLIGALLLLWMAYGFGIYGQGYLAKHKSDRVYYSQKLRQAIPGDPSDYSAVALYGVMNGKNPKADIFNNPPAMHAIVHSLGVKDYRDCRQDLDPRCADLVINYPLSTLRVASGEFLFSVTRDNVAVIQYREMDSY